MGCTARIEFPVIYIDGELLPCARSIYAPCNEITIKGVKTIRAWDARTFQFFNLTGTFLNCNGVEYCATLTQEQILTLCTNACNGGTGTNFRYFEDEFEIEFE